MARSVILPPSPLDRADLRVLKYVPREIHALKGQSSHNVIAHISAIQEKEKETPNDAESWADKCIFLLRVRGGSAAIAARTKKVDAN